MGIPLRIYAYLAAILAVLGLAWSVHHRIDAAGYDRCRNEVQVATTTHIERAQEQARQIALQDAEVAEGFEVWRTKIITKYVDVPVEVVREITHDCTQCRIGPDGLRRLNELRSGGVPQAPAHPGQPDSTLPAPGAATGGNLPRGIRPVGDGQPAIQHLREEIGTASHFDQRAPI